MSTSKTKRRENQRLRRRSGLFRRLAGAFSSLAKEWQETADQGSTDSPVMREQVRLLESTAEHFRELADNQFRLRRAQQVAEADGQIQAAIAQLREELPAPFGSHPALQEIEGAAAKLNMIFDSE